LAKSAGTPAELGSPSVNAPEPAFTNNDLFKLLHDIQQAISLSITSVNIKLLLDNVLIVWSHITHLNTYLQILN
jgi:hypothetical protein